MISVQVTQRKSPCKWLSWIAWGDSDTGQTPGSGANWRELIPLYEATVHLRRVTAAAAQTQTVHVLAGCLVIRTRRAGLACEKSSGWRANCRRTKIQYTPDKHEPYHLCQLIGKARDCWRNLVQQWLWWYLRGLHLTATADCLARFLQDPSIVESDCLFVYSKQVRTFVTRQLSCLSTY